IPVTRSTLFAPANGVHANSGRRWSLRNTPTGSSSRDVDERLRPRVPRKQLLAGQEVELAPVHPGPNSPSRRSTSRRWASIDQYRGARSAVRHLVELGHTRILHLARPRNALDAIERARGWRDELASHRLRSRSPRSATGPRPVGTGSAPSWTSSRGWRPS